QGKVAAMKSQLSDESFGDELKQTIAELDKQINALGYNRDEHVALKDKLEKLIPSSEKFRDLERARTETPALQQSLQTNTSSLNSKLQQVTDLDEETRKLEIMLSELPALNLQIDELQPALEEFRRKQRQLASVVAVLES